VLERYVAALREPTPSNLGKLDAVLAPDVEVVGLVGAGSSAGGVRASLERPLMPGLLDGASWQAPRAENDVVSVEAVLADGARYAAILFFVHVGEEGSITRVEQQVRPLPPPPAVPLRLTDEIKATVAGALANGTPVLVSYVDADGAPHLSPRGSTQPYGDTQLAIWVRDPGGGLLRGIAAHPRIALLYRDGATRTTYTFAGRAHAEHDAVVRDTVYAHTPELERNLDALRLGVPVIVDLDRVEGMGPAGRVVMVA
jgi:hypothetical protein